MMTWQGVYWSWNGNAQYMGVGNAGGSGASRRAVGGVPLPMSHLGSSHANLSVPRPSPLIRRRDL